jgi:hypothetical protein
MDDKLSYLEDDVFSNVYNAKFREAMGNEGGDYVIILNENTTIKVGEYRGYPVEKYFTDKLSSEENFSFCKLMVDHPSPMNDTICIAYS